MKFTVNGKDQKVMLKDASRDEDGNYVFRCDVVAKEMADTITAQMYRQEYEPVGQVHKYSVREYADHILKNSGDYSKQTVDLVQDKRSGKFDLRTGRADGSLNVSNDPLH